MVLSIFEQGGGVEHTACADPLGLRENAARNATPITLIALAPLTNIGSCAPAPAPSGHAHCPAREPSCDAVSATQPRHLQITRGRFSMTACTYAGMTVEEKVIVSPARGSCNCKAYDGGRGHRGKHKPDPKHDIVSSKVHVVLEQNPVAKECNRLPFVLQWP